MKLLVTGGAGFIGSNYVHYWLKKHPKDKIRVLDALTYAGNIENLKPVLNKIEFVQGDITNREQVAESLKGIDAVVHYAAESHVDRSIFDPQSFWKTNVEGTQILLEESKKAKVTRFHHVSTDEVYGELPFDSREKFSDKTPYAPSPDNLYANSKAEADRVVMEFYKQTGMYITISNCSNNYGPYQFPEKYIPILVTNLIDGMKAPLHGDGRHVRDWIHTEDHATAVDVILSKGKSGETYLIGSDNDLPNKYIAERVVYLSGKDESWIKHVPDRHSNDRRYAIDATKLRNELSWKPIFPREKFDEGVTQTIAWYKKNDNWWRPLLKRKATIVSGDKKIFAFISLDREVGKSKFFLDSAPHEEAEEEKKSVLGSKLYEEDERKVRLISNKLKLAPWFKETAKNIQKELLTLAKNSRASGFVEHLANRHENLPTGKILRLLKVEHSPNKYPIYGIAAWFEVLGKDGVKRSEGYYSWGMGPKSGAKLLVLVKHRGKITHLALTKEEKFSVGDITFGLAGGFPKLNESVFDLITRKIQDDLGINVSGGGQVSLSEIISLGRVMPDAGMTNNHPLIYAVIVELEDNIFPPIREGEIYEQNEGAVLWPVNKLSELVNRVDDSYFLSSLSRLTLSGITNLKLG